MRFYEILNLINENIQYITDKYSTSKELQNAINNDNSARDVIRNIEDPKQRGIEVLEKIKEADPEEGRTRTYDWLALQYMKGQFKIEDIQMVRQGLELFYRFRNRIEKKDLMAYKTIGELYDTVQQFKQVSTGRQAFEDLVEKVLSTGENKVLIKTPDFVVIEILDFKCSLRFADITNWCTTQRGNFDSYTSGGKYQLYVIMALVGDKTMLYQYQVEGPAGTQFKQRNDQDVTQNDVNILSGFPKYKDFLNFLIKKYYGKYFDEQPSSDVTESGIRRRVR